ncbi:right-handed parallel beta-helix repeat-containing protein [Haloglomus litoreum]|uniref:right-handed parallel beta-helix repeat-containing protein n=1 Tax=Haloglomus litoreum TaxID=3034026 RepID=UPI0023E846D6|nr:right-handed parallel beta-helix repeat-containing protein [Haloglomus sp. DT116]
MTLLVVTSSFVAFVAAPVAGQSTITVDDSGGADHTTIQAAIDAASAGDTIQVAAGTYTGSINVSKQLTLRGDPGDSAAGAGPNAPVIAPNGREYGFNLTADASGTVIEGFDIGAFGDGSIYLDVASGTTLSDVTIRDNDIDSEDDAVDGQSLDGNLVRFTFTRNYLDGEYGVYLDVYGDTYEDLVFTDNVFDELGDEMIYLYVNEDGTTVSGLTVTGNEMSGEYEAVYVYVSENDDGVLTDVDISDNTMDYVDSEAIDIYAAGVGLEVSDIRIQDNVIRSDDEGIEVDVYDDDVTVENVVISGNDVESDEEEAIDVDLESYGNGGDGGISGVTISENTAGSPGDEEAIVLYVYGSGNPISDVSIVENVVTGAEEDGIDVYVELQDATATNVAVSRNEVQSADLDGIEFEIYGDSGATVNGVEISGNTLTGDDYGVFFYVDGVDLQNAVISENTIDDAGDDGIYLYVGEIPSGGSAEVDVTRNLVTGSTEYGLYVEASLVDTVDILVERNQFTSNDGGILVTGDFDRSGINVTENNIVGNGVGVQNSQVAQQQGQEYVDARNNWWGNETGPGSLTATTGLFFEDPVSDGVLANGTGDLVSGNDSTGLANVRFAPFATTAFDIADLPDPPTLGGGGSRPAKFAITEDSISPQTVEIGESTTVSYVVTNTGGRTGTYVALLTADGKLVDTQEIRLRAGESETVTHEFARNNAGSYYIQTRTWVIGRLTVTPLRETKADVESDLLRGGAQITITDPVTGEPVFLALPFTEASNQTGIHLESLNLTLDERTDYEVDVQQPEDLDRLGVGPDGPIPLVGGGTQEFGYFVIDIESEGNVTGAEFVFSIRKELYEQFAGETDPTAGTTLYRYDPETGTWERYEMELVGETDTTYRFRVSTPGFSAFAVGTPGPAFDVRNVSLAQQTIEAGDFARVQAVVENTGERNGTYTAVLTVDGDRRATEDVFVPAGESRDIDFRETFPEAGNYDLALNDIAVGTLTVEAAATPTPTETPTPEPTETSTEAPTEAPEPTDTPTEAEETPATTETSGQPGFALVTALLALLAAALLAARRRDRD